MYDNPILIKTFAFSIRIIKLYRHLVDEHREYTLSKELLVAGTHIGKHVKEAVNAESRQVLQPKWASHFVRRRRRSTGCS